MQAQEIESLPSKREVPDIDEKPRQSHGQILKSSGLIGSSQLINVGFRIVRTKAMALLLGPSGVGLLSLYSSISDTATIFAGMGLNSSGVRQIAEAVATGDTQRIARTVIVLRRVALVLGVVGALLLIALCRPLSRSTFGDDLHAGQITLLSLAVLFGAITAAQVALVQGMRRIADLARLSVLGALFGTIFSVTIVYLLGQEGVVPSLVCVAAMGIATSWWYARKIKVEQVTMTWGEVANEASELLKLGLAMVAGAMLNVLAAYTVRILIRQNVGMAAIGFYQAAWVLGGFYVDFILQAMGADFYPRLTAVANRNSECNRLVNEQTEVGLLLAGPGLLATLTFAPTVISLLYSAQFQPAVGIFRWICLGMMLRVATWPMGFIQLAKGRRHIFLGLQFVASVLQVGLVWFGLKIFGLIGAGIAFFVFFLSHFAIVRWVAGRVSGFCWSTANRRLGATFALLSAAVFGSWYVLPRALSMNFGAVVTFCAGIYSLKTLFSFVPMQRFPPAMQKLARILHLAPAE
jgi:Membrane protein involved in the export of O-antigen and teichoic acid